ncbi:hypothetical protein TYRP_008134 [Tyrophagus putrescentiae]|nr:hypothetical protein TYRP_008134 [Tyrophagus putrescentiae]
MKSTRLPPWPPPWPPPALVRSWTTCLDTATARLLSLPEWLPCSLDSSSDSDSSSSSSLCPWLFAFPDMLWVIVRLYNKVGFIHRELRRRRRRRRRRPTRKRSMSLEDSVVVISVVSS